MLEAQNVAYRVGRTTLLEDVSLTLRRGTLLALIGPNGAGKSTLLRVLAGELRPSSGRVLLDGAPLTAYSKHDLALRRAVMPQDVFLGFNFTAGEVVMMGRYPHQRHGRAAQDRRIVKESMERTETAPLRERVYPTLSGGEQSRVTLARVLAQETPVMLLDEPTASLDPRHQHLVMGIARDAADRGGSVVAVLHDLNLAALYADEVILLAGGRVQAAGSPHEVLTPATLEAVFRTPFQVITPPDTGKPIILSLPVDGKASVASIG